MNKRLIIAFMVGILTTLIVARVFSVIDTQTQHPIGYANNNNEVHVHSDFIVYLAGEIYDFTDDVYQTTSQQTKHAHVHLHDNVGHIIHRHDHGVTLAAFFDSLGYTLSDTCITTDSSATFCTNESEQLLLFVNGIPTTTIATHVSAERDQLLMYYGAPDAPVIDELLEQVTDEACIYSGTCIERGIAPPESCGLTCEL